MSAARIAEAGLALVAIAACAGSEAGRREEALRRNLATLREAIHQHVADRGQGPRRLDDLVAAGYLQSLPFDPMTRRSDSWSEVVSVDHGGERTVVDVRSGAAGRAEDGSPFDSW